MAGIFDAIEKPTKEVLERLLNDRSLRKLVTYKRFVSEQFDNALGYNVEVTDDVEELRAIRLRHTQDSIRLSSGEVASGDMLYMVAFEDMPVDDDGELNTSLKDVVVDESGKRFRVKAIDDIFGIAVSITVSGAF